jgi:hypothetical protein
MFANLSFYPAYESSFNFARKSGFRQPVFLFRLRTEFQPGQEKRCSPTCLFIPLMNRVSTSPGKAVFANLSFYSAYELSFNPARKSDVRQPVFLFRL